MNQLGRCQQRFVEILQLSKRLQEFLRFHDQDLDGPKIENNRNNKKLCRMCHAFMNIITEFSIPGSIILSSINHSFLMSDILMPVVTWYLGERSVPRQCIKTSTLVYLVDGPCRRYLSVFCKYRPITYIVMYIVHDHTHK